MKKVKHYPHLCWRIYHKQNKVDNLNNDTKTIDSGHKKSSVGPYNSIVSPQEGVEECANIRQTLEVLRRSVLYNSPERSAAFINNSKTLSSFSFEGFGSLVETISMRLRSYTGARNISTEMMLPANYRKIAIRKDYAKNITY